MMEKRSRAPARAVVAPIAALFVLFAVVLVTAPVRADAPPRGTSYRNIDYYGHTWVDAEKSPTDTDDDLLCWAAAAANVLDYTGWGHVAGMSTTDQMFAYYRNHWTDAGGLMEFGWNWWFDGVNDSQGWSGWSQVDAPGGGFHPTRNYGSYYHEQWNTSLVMSSLGEFLRAGYGVGLALYGPGGHAVTSWGYNYDPADPSTYYGVWISDSDDDKGLTSPPDRLRYYDVAYSSNRWYLQNYYGSNSWYIGGVEALAMIPEPAAIVTLISGLLGLLAFRRRSNL